MGILQLLSSIKAALNCEVSFIDFQCLIKTGELSVASGFYQKALNIVKNEAPDVLGIQTLCVSYHLAITFARLFKELCPGTRIVLGGPQAAMVDRETIETFPCIDFVVRGEAEISFVELIRNIDSPQIVEGITLRDASGAVQRNPDRPVIKDLDDHIYANSELDGYLSPYFMPGDIAPIEAGRGCPFNCTFCSTSIFWKRSLRMRSYQGIIAQMKYYHKTFKIKDFSFTADNLTVNKKWLLGLIKALKKYRAQLDIGWSCFSKIDHLSPSLIKKMAKTGLFQISIGIETGSQRMQKILKKNNDLSLLYPVVKACVKWGVNCKIFFMMGFPEETPQDLNDTLATMLRLRLLGVIDIFLSLLSPIPGTEVFAKHGQDLVKAEAGEGFSKFTFQSKELLQLDKFNLIDKYPKIFSSFYNISTKNIPLKCLYAIRTAVPDVFRFFSRSFFLLMHEQGLTCYDMFQQYFKFLEQNELAIDDAGNFSAFVSSRTSHQLKRPYLSDIIRFETLVYDLSQREMGKGLVDPLPALTRNTAVASFSYDVFKMYDKIEQVPRRSSLAYLFSCLRDGSVKYRRVGQKERSLIELMDGQRSCQEIFEEYSRIFPRAKKKEARDLLRRLCRDGYV